MAFIKPSTGDLWDRAIVLELKIMNGWAKEQNVQHFRDELAEIQKIISPSLKEPKLGIILKDMHLIHQRLWDATNLQWEAKDDSSPFFMAWLAKETRDLNRKRTELKEKIEKLLGEWKGQDKI